MSGVSQTGMGSATCQTGRGGLEGERRAHKPALDATEAIHGRRWWQAAGGGELFAGGGAEGRRRTGAGDRPDVEGRGC
jgi:hypothetical protein